MLCLPRFTPWLLASLAVCLLLTPPAMAQKVKKNVTVTLVPNSVSVGGTVTGTVTHNTSTGSDVWVDLTSSTGADVNMPTPVKIDVGQSSASFTVTAGTTPQTVTITASAGGFQSGSASLTITPKLPSMAYKLIELPNSLNPYAVAINSNLQIVGWAQSNLDANGKVVPEAFLYEFIDGQWRLMTLNDLLTQADKNKIAERGYSVSKFRDINDQGVIVGHVHDSESSPTIADGIIFDLATNTLTFMSDLYPEYPELSDFSYLLLINNLGVIAGELETNGVASTFVATYPRPLEPAPPALKIIGNVPAILYRSALSDAGVLSGAGVPGTSRSPQYETWQYDILTETTRQISSSADKVWLHGLDSHGRYAGKKDIVNGNKTTGFPIIFDPEVGIVWQSASPGPHPHLNDDGDFLFKVTRNTRDTLHLRNLDVPAGELNIDDLIAPGDRDRWLALTQTYFITEMTQKLSLTSTSFGAILGRATSPANRMFILIPTPFNR